MASTPAFWTTRARRWVREQVFDRFLLRWMKSQVMHLDHDAALRLAALLDGAQYAAAHMQGARATPDKTEVLRFGLDHTPPEGLVLACGVFSVAGLEAIGTQLGRVAYGFELRPPALSQATSAKLMAGRFEHTVPAFLAQHPGPIAFLHIDTDLYAQSMSEADGTPCDVHTASKSALDIVGDRLVPGSVVVLDEYFNSPGWREQEFRAFQEMVQSRALNYRYLAYDTTGFGTVALQIVA